MHSPHLLDGPFETRARQRGRLAEARTFVPSPDGVPRALRERGQLRCFDPREAVVQGGEPVREAHVVLSGTLLATRDRCSSSSLPYLYTPGSITHTGDLTPSERQGDRVEAVGATRTMAWALDEFLTLVTTDLDSILWFAGRLAAQFEQVEVRRLDMRRGDTQARLAALLYAVGDPVGSSKTQASWVWLSQFELAQLLGVDRGTVNRGLRQFVRRGWLQQGLGEIFVCDGESLRARGRHSEWPLVAASRESAILASCGSLQEPQSPGPAASSL